MGTIEWGIKVSTIAYKKRVFRKPAVTYPKFLWLIFHIKLPVLFLGASILSGESKEEKGKAEEAAEKTGEVVGKGLKKGFGVAKAFGKGAKEAVTEKKEEKKERSS
ncbi:MAG: hypothetical protein FJZ49_04410 [Candidatus Verstraetearchaeota archaeon]|nr:hypothetical protein [Candidatus Verstraetearchaeota archaeon]